VQIKRFKNLYIYFEKDKSKKNTESNLRTTFCIKKRGCFQDVIVSNSSIPGDILLKIEASCLYDTDQLTFIKIHFVFILLTLSIRCYSQLQ
jgi:hypothetical protein